MLAVSAGVSSGLLQSQHFEFFPAEHSAVNLASRTARGQGVRFDKNVTPEPRSSSQRRTMSTLDKKRRDSMLAARGRETRRERTYIGSECAVCEEPLEHILRGERILQLVCGHTAHQACFYEYTRELEASECPTCNAPLGLDPSRGVAADFDTFNRFHRAGPTPDPQGRAWDAATAAQDGFWNPEALLRNDKPPMLPPKTYTMPQERHSTLPSRHRSTEDWHKDGVVDGQRNAYSKRQHDIDQHSIATSTIQPHATSHNPIPPPIVTIRSEYPTLSRSRQQQSMTCLITVEVTPGKWRMHANDLHGPGLQEQRSPQKTLTSKKSQSSAPSTRSNSQRNPESTTHFKHLNQLKEQLFTKVDNWHGLDYTRFGNLLLHGTIRVGKDKQSWQELECYLFTQMLICVKEKKSGTASQEFRGTKLPGKFALKGSILIKRHLQEVQYVPEEGTLTLILSVAELPFFHLRFADHAQLEVWKIALSNVEHSSTIDSIEDDDAAISVMNDGDEDEDDVTDGRGHSRRLSPMRSSSRGADNRSPTTEPTEYTESRAGIPEVPSIASALHVPIDIVVVVPVSSSMQGLKSNLLRDALRFVLANLGVHDRMALVTFGSGAGGVPVVGMSNKNWPGWTNVLDNIVPDNNKGQRADVVDGANVAMDLLMQRKVSNSVSSVLLISDSPTSDVESVDFVISRAEAAKITIQSFGLGLTHKPDTMVELSNKTKGSYTFVKDWMMLRECLAGCLGALQSTSHQNVKLKLHLPEESPAKFVKISGALSITKRATGRDAEVMLGDLRFGERRDILVQVSVPPDATVADSPTSDPWEHIISNLEALGGTLDSEDLRGFSIEEMPLVQADLSWGDILRGGSLTQLPRPSLLAITILPPMKKGARPQTPPIPPHPHVVQRRMELLTSDMLSRALVLVGRNQHDRAGHLLAETRSILQGLGKGSLPPLPPTPQPPNLASRSSKISVTSNPSSVNTAANIPLPESSQRTPTPPRSEHSSAFASASGIDQAVINALDSDLECSLEYITHPHVFNRDARKNVLQEIGVINSQRAYTFRSPIETLWARRISGIQRLLNRSRDWRETAELQAS